MTSRLSAGLLALTLAFATPASADMIGDFGQVEQAVADTMSSELGDILTDLPGLPPIIDCGCPHLCGFLAALASGEVRGEEVQVAALTALTKDRAMGLEMALAAGGKFDASMMTPVEAKMDYTDDFDPERAVDLLKRAGAAVLR